MTDQPITRTAREARGADIILDTRPRRTVFIAGLAAMVLLALLGFGLA
ncbi:peptide ABC transporter permease [Novosphingobium sp. PC22D]|nr:peptide ABC transporter permease [Novosphingobium sp. PC22D]